MTRMRITPDWNVWIWITNPTEKLDLRDWIFKIVDSGTSVTWNSWLSFWDADNNWNYKWIQSYDSQPLSLNPIWNNVWIWTTTPTEKLDVNWNIRFAVRDSIHSHIWIWNDHHDMIIADNTLDKYYWWWYFLRVHDSSAPHEYRNALLIKEDWNIRVPNLWGSGNAYACLDSSWTLYRSATACN